MKNNIKQLKKELGLNNKDLAEFFDMKLSTYANSSAKERYENALCRFYSHIKKASAEKIKEKKPRMKPTLIKNEPKPLIIHDVVGRSEQLKTEKEPLPYFEWKAQLNMQKIEDTIFKIGNEYKTINDLLDMYEDYYHSF